MSKKVAFAALSAVLLLAPAVHAAPTPDPDAQGLISLHVPLTGLNLSSPGGAAIALRRIHAAAVEICGAEPSRRELAQSAQFERCVGETVDRARLALPRPDKATANAAPVPTMQLARNDH